ASAAAVKMVASKRGDERRRQLWHRICEFRASANSPIVPIIIGGAQAAVEASEKLRQRGVLTPAIRYPSVARGKARLRISFSASHTAADVLVLQKALGEIGLQGDA